MTRNQIDFAKAVETARSNRVNEQLTSARDENTVRIARRQLKETTRHNRAQESVALGQLANQQQQVANAFQLGVLGAKETQRANRAREQEQFRSNVAKESETYRSNLQHEALQLGQLQEVQRANLASESIRRQQNAIQSASVAEQARANRASEALRSQQISVDQQRVNLGLAQLSESQRQANLSFYSRQGELDETRRANQAREAENTRANQARELETARHNATVEAETSRSNLASEALEQQRRDLETGRFLTDNWWEFVDLFKLGDFGGS